MNKVSHFPGLPQRLSCARDFARRTRPHRRTKERNFGKSSHLNNIGHPLGFVSASSAFTPSHSGSIPALSLERGVYSPVIDELQARQRRLCCCPRPFSGLPYLSARHTAQYGPAIPDPLFEDNHPLNHAGRRRHRRMGVLGAG